MKIAEQFRVDVSAYEAKNRRRKIVSAYSTCPLVGAAYIGVDENPEFGIIIQGVVNISSSVTYKATPSQGQLIMSGSRLDKTITDFLQVHNCHS